MIRLLLGAVLMLLVSTSPLVAEEQDYPIDDETGLIIAPGYAMVKANCTACHAGKLVAQMRGTRETWVALIRWMQATQNLWQFPPTIETTILDYLEEHYAPRATGLRRPPLDPSLLPDWRRASRSGN